MTAYPTRPRLRGVAISRELRERPGLTFSGQGCTRGGLAQGARVTIPRSGRPGGRRVRRMSLPLSVKEPLDLPGGAVGEQARFNELVPDAADEDHVIAAPGQVAAAQSLVPQFFDGPDQLSPDCAGLPAHRDVLLSQRPGFLEMPHSCLIVAIPSGTRSACRQITESLAAAARCRSTSSGAIRREKRTGRGTCLTAATRAIRNESR